MLAWSDIDTVLLDMDGTLIDLRFDNILWNHRLPAMIADARGIGLEAAREHLYAHMKDAPPSLHYYCVDYWTAYTGMDIAGLHASLGHLVEYRAGAERFISALRASGRRAVLVTNAHPKSLAVKDGRVRLTQRLDARFSSHEFGFPKEAAEFWPAFALREHYDPAKTLLIDDNAAVLRTAAASGIRHVLCVTQPDSEQPPRTHLPFPAFNHFDELPPPPAADGATGAPAGRGPREGALAPRSKPPS